MDLPTRRPLGAVFIGLSLLAALPALAATGRTPGNPSVTRDGEAAYSVPLVLPPGTNGMTPVLSLEYRHRAISDVLGIGWTLGGLSQIAQCPRTLAQDGIPAQPILTFVVRYCLDGQRLVVANGKAYGAADAEYRTEIESYARIRSIAGAGAGTRYFVVEAADGRIFEYGATADSRIDGDATNADIVPSARIWALNRIRDRAGNVIDYGYTEDAANGSFRIANIRYNSNPAAGVAASHRVSFVYEIRPSNEIDIAYLAGMPIRQVVRLDRIDVSYGSELLRRYDLRYEPALSTAGRSRLASVQECGVGGSECHAPTVFAWQNGVPGYGAQVSFVAAIPGRTPLFDHFLWNMADIDGDGCSDFVWAGGSTLGASTIHYRLGCVGGTLGPEVNSGIPSPNGIGSPFDADGDARTDLLTVSPTGVWTIMPGSASGLGAPVVTDVAVPNQLIDFRGLDLNGDGLGDIAWSERIGNGGNGLVVRARYALPDGGYSATPTLLYEQAKSTTYPNSEGGNFIGRPGRRVDLDGNGSEELMMNENYSLALISLEGSGSLKFDGTFKGGVPLDFNGDGCTDFVYKHYTTQLRLRIGGCRAGWSSTELLGPSNSDSLILTAHDWNSDGREDILLRGPTNWLVASSAGASVLPVTDTGVAREDVLEAVGADVNGDGLSDFVTRKGSELRVRMRNGPRADLLLAATDGFGVTAQFTYRPLTDATVYTRGEGAVYPAQDLQSGAQVVSELAVSDGTGQGSLLRTAYRYEGLRRDLLGRGSLGFEKLTREDLTPERRLLTVETRRQDYPFTGLPRSIVVRQSSGKPVATTSVQWSALSFGSDGAIRRFPYVRKVTSRRYEAGGSYDGTEIANSVRTVAAIDEISGVVTDETTTLTEVATGGHPGSSASMRTQRTNLVNDTANWCLGRPQDIQRTASHTLAGGDPVARSVSQAWDGAACRPTQMRLEPGSSQWQVTHGLTYDAFGNIASHAVTGAGMAARTTVIDWGERGQQPESIANPLAQVTRFSWNPGSGRLLSATDANALTIRWAYDAFERPLREDQPDATSTTWVRAACAGDCDARTRIRLTQQDRDSGGAVRVTTTLDFDQHGRAFRMAEQRPGGGTAVTTLDTSVHGQLLRKYLPHWEGAAPPGYWQLEYDAIGRLARGALHQASGAIERLHTLRHDGLAAVYTDPLGRTNTGIRTAWGRLAQVTDAAGNSSRYEYDAFGNLTRIQDALNNTVSSVAYNARGMKVAQTDLDMGSWTWTRNALGETTTLRDGRSQVIRFSYDALGRTVTRTAPDGVSNLTWGQSATQRNIGQLASIAGPGYSESWGYDAVGRPASRTIVTDATYRYNYAYNSFGLLESMTYPAAGSSARLKLRYEYDAGRVSRILDANAPDITFWQLHTVDAAGRVIDETKGSAVRVVTGIDPLTGGMDYRLAGTGSDTAIQNLAFAWDKNDNLIRREDLNRGLVEEFRYDPLDRLDDSRRNGVVNLNLAYDAIGNIIWKSDVCFRVAPCYTYHPARKHALTSAGGQVFSYDGNGNMKSRSGATIAWTSGNLLSSIAYSNGKSSQFSYGPAGNRWRQVASHGGTTETTTYAGELLERFKRDGSTTWRHYVMAPTGVAAIRSRNPDGTIATHLVTQDHLGSTDRILDATGTNGLTASFSSFGRRRDATWTGVPTAQDLAAIAAVTRDGFTGHEHLDHLELIHMNGRVFDPHLGRFISADPYLTAPFNSQAHNRYSYVWNNPLSYVDPTGFDGETPCMQTQQGNCAQITVIGVSWQDYYRLIGGTGPGQVESAAQRDPCGQEGSALACAMQGGRLVSPSSVVLTIGYKSDPGLASTPTHDYLQGAVARLGNIAISSSPLTWLFGADPDFEWFDVPDSAAGQIGQDIGNLGVLAGGVGAIAKSAVNHLPREVARVIRGKRNPTTIGRPGDVDAFVVAADDIAGLNAAQLAERLTIDPSDYFTVIKFGTPASGIASPVFRSNTGFLQGGFTRGGAREFVVPNGPIPADAIIRYVGP